MNMNLVRIEAAQSYLERELITYKLISRLRGEPPLGLADAGRYHFLGSFADVHRLYFGSKKKKADPKQWFYFNDGMKSIDPAGNLGELIDRLHTLDLSALRFHFQRGDFARWIRDVLCHDNLALRLESLNTMKLSDEMLRCALLDILEEEAYLAACSKDPEFLHGLALMHWEWALEFDVDNNKDDNRDKNDGLELAAYHYRYAKYYWMHLLGRKGYWQSFAEQCYKAKQPAPEDTSANLRLDICRTILHHHYNRCRTNLNSGKLDAAKFHLKCLCNWNALEDKTYLELDDKPILRQQWDQSALEEADKEVSEIINRWMSEWLKHANAMLDDPAVDLPRGISKNFKGALEYTQPYLELVARHPQLFQRLLMFVLTQANKWCYETAIAGDHEVALTVMDGVGPVIEQMESFLTKPEANSVAKPEQKVLSTCYSLWTQLIIKKDVKRGQAYAEASVAWDPGDPQAKDVHDQMEQLGVRVSMDQAHEYIENKEFQKAIDILQEIDLEKHKDAKKSVHSYLTGAHYQWAMELADLANQETEDLLKKRIFQKIEKTTQMINAVRYLGEARDHIAEALKYEPGHPVLAENLEQLTQEAEYRPYTIKTKVGIERFEKDDYDNALVALEGKFPKDFPGCDTVLQVRAGCFFRRAIQHANNERFDAAVVDMRQAQALVPDNEVVREQLAEIEKIRKDFPHLKAMREGEELLEKEKYHEALNVMEKIPGNFSGKERVQSLKAICEFKIGIQHASARNLDEAIEHLEKAAKYNSSEPVILQQLSELRKIKNLGGFDAIERHNRAVQKAEEVIKELNKASSRYPLTSEQGYRLLAKLEEAVTESDGDPQIVALRDQLQQVLLGRSRY